MLDFQSSSSRRINLLIFSTLAQRHNRIRALSLKGNRITIACEPINKNLWSSNPILDRNGYLALPYTKKGNIPSFGIEAGKRTLSALVDKRFCLLWDIYKL